ncbi:2416_t:CDS:2 [Dentiscutata heterogama]|uniref:2416_t:CDS:1 n=1 Tax=Dentiscutata heterogama TaxID=1316150 RepID=A0ACA9KTI3_9GLOM|nr:2416_t:CDS:2 [Dentiscutata heterogama]
MSSSVSNYMLDDDDTYSVREEPDESLTCKTKKRKNRENRSIAWDYFETETTEKGDFDVCQICKKKNIDVKYAHDSLTGNMLGHLWSKHRIDKDHPEETTTDTEAIKEFLNQVITDWGLTGRVFYAQEKCRYSKFYQTIDDVSTRWNSSYLAWIRLKELRKAIDYLVLMLLSESERSTNIFSDSSYPLLNLVYPTMKLLIKGQSQPIDNEGPDELDIENEFDTLVTSEQLRQPLQALQG